MLKKWSLIFVLLSLIQLGCSKYQKILKSSDTELKYNAAIAYYEDEKYERAMPLFEELIPLFRGTERSEKVYYMYAYCNFNENLLYGAAYHFKKFSITFPNSSHAEEALFMNGYSLYLLSPIATLDQTETYNAINSLQLFINTFPKNELVDSSNVLMDRLRGKLEQKSYLNSKQYYKIFDYKAAIVALNNTLKDYPETNHREEIAFLILKSHYLLSENSVKAKKLERIRNTIEAYYTFVDSYKESKYLKEAEHIFTKMGDEQNKIKLENL
jgi:outer membrane protein assembly factor BamD